MDRRAPTLPCFSIILSPLRAQSTPLPAVASPSRFQPRRLEGRECGNAGPGSQLLEGPVWDEVGGEVSASGAASKNAPVFNLLD